jgi:23S rRNA (guanosine2251-2'-O)-methyltransferase
MRIYGINPTVEAIKAGRVTALLVAERQAAGERDRLAGVVELAEAQGIPVRRAGAGELARLAQGGAHQGVVADVRNPAAVSLDDLVAEARPSPLIVVLDQIEDPHNVGAILRSVDAAGAHGVIRQSRHAARLDGAAAKASAGAVTHVRIVDVVNIARALEQLKAAGIWTVGLAGDGAKRYDEINFTLPTAIVLGAEGTGLRRLVRERCDWVASIPMQGHVGSLNVSVAAGIALFEAVRQRRSAG